MILEILILQFQSMNEQQLSFKLLRQQNYQLKNQISQLKNAFDLNRDILKILSEQSRQKNPDMKVHYQIIRRLTSLNNQTMIAFADMVHDKISLKSQNQKLKSQIMRLNQRLEQTVRNVREKYNPKEIQLQLREQMQICRGELLKMKGQLVLKQQEISRLRRGLQVNDFKSQMNEFQPIQPITRSTAYTYETEMEKPLSKLQSTKLEQENMRIQQLINKNCQLTQYAQELQGRIVILLKALQFQPQEHNQQNIRQVHKPQADLQLSLLNFALNHMKVTQESEDFKISMSRRYTNRRPIQKDIRRKSI